MNNKILILLSTYNGEKYLIQQLNSLYNQTYRNLKIIARDDNSLDGTLNILKSYNIEIIPSNKNIGAKKSFSILLEYALNNTDSEYFMFCDQDDIWNNNKIEKTLNKIQELECLYKKIPLLIHTDLEIVNKKLDTINKSMWDYEYINPNNNKLNNLLLQNTATGCTMMINRQLANLSLPIPDNCIMHDWWIALVASKFGKIGFISEPTIKYRQHEDNDTGAKRFGYIMAIKKAYSIIFSKNRYNYLSKHILQSESFLLHYRTKLDNNTKSILGDFSNIKNKSFFQKRKIIIKNKFFKTGLIKNIGLLIII
jgi:glycosyltransferase involved in cell wall biosynthesis